MQISLQWIEGARNRRLHLFRLCTDTLNKSEDIKSVFVHEFFDFLLNPHYYAMCSSRPPHGIAMRFAGGCRRVDAAAGLVGLAQRARCLANIARAVVCAAGAGRHVFVASAYSSALPCSA
jgi:hypothetical protein